jgi:hypothetical protein
VPALAAEGRLRARVSAHEDHAASSLAHHSAAVQRPAAGGAAAGAGAPASALLSARAGLSPELRDFGGPFAPLGSSARSEGLSDVAARLDYRATRSSSDARAGPRRHSLDAAPAASSRPAGWGGDAAAAAAGTDPASEAMWARLQDDEDRAATKALGDESPGAFELFGGGRARTSGRSNPTAKVSPLTPPRKGSGADDVTGLGGGLGGLGGGGTWKVSRAFGRRGSRYDNDGDGGSLAGRHGGQRLGTARTSDDETGADTENEYTPAKSVNKKTPRRVVR